MASEFRKFMREVEKLRAYAANEEPRKEPPMAGEVLKILDDILTDKDISQIRSNVATVKALGEMCDNVTVTLAAHCERLLFARETLMTCNLKAAVLRGQDCERIAELESRFLPRCEVCGYNRDDAALHCDHHLCSGEIPETPETLRAEAAEREVAVKTSAAEILGDQVVNSECENAALRLKLSTAERDRDVLVAAMRSVFSDDKAGWLKIYDTDDVGVAAFCQCYHLSRADFDRLILNIAADAKGKTDG